MQAFWFNRITPDENQRFCHSYRFSNRAQAAINRSMKRTLILLTLLIAAGLSYTAGTAIAQDTPDVQSFSGFGLLNTRASAPFRLDEKYKSKQFNLTQPQGYVESKILHRGIQKGLRYIGKKTDSTEPVLFNRNPDFDLSQIGSASIEALSKDLLRSGLIEISYTFRI